MNFPLRVAWRWIPCGLLLVNLALAAEPHPRFSINGAGTLNLDTPLQQSSGLALKATLSPGITIKEPQTQSGNEFSLNADLSGQSMVCYDDTIFRDDFDGDSF